MKVGREVKTTDRVGRTLMSDDLDLIGATGGRAAIHGRVTRRKGHGFSRAVGKHFDKARRSSGRRALKSSLPQSLLLVTTLKERPFMAASIDAEIQVERRFSAAFSNQLDRASFSSTDEASNKGAWRTQNGL